MALHYAFTMKVTAEQEPKGFTGGTRNPRWMEAMDEDLQALGLRLTLELEGMCWEMKLHYV